MNKGISSILIIILIIGLIVAGYAVYKLKPFGQPTTTIKDQKQVGSAISDVGNVVKSISSILDDIDKRLSK